jgi:hypothetical protein
VRNIFFFFLAFVLCPHQIKCKSVKQVRRKLDLEDLRMQLNNQRSTLDVMDFIFTLQEETKLKLKVAHCLVVLVEC